MYNKTSYESLSPLEEFTYTISYLKRDGSGGERDYTVMAHSPQEARRIVGKMWMAERNNFI